MAATDPLILLRSSLAASRPPVFTTSSDPTEAPSKTTESIPEATHLYFSYPTPLCIPLGTPTRFISKQAGGEEPIQLRSIYFAWLNKDTAVPEYMSTATELNQSLPEGHKIRNLVFLEKADLTSWLVDGTETDYIKPLEGDNAVTEAARKAAEIAGGAGIQTVGATGIGVTQQTAGGRPIKVIDARLQQVYNGERSMGDHNTVLRGIKPTDFSHVRKHAETFLGRRKQHPSQSRPGQSHSKMPSRPAPAPSKPLSSAVSSKRSDPIILLSPSASSLLRMSNIKSFLDSGLFVPPDHPTLSSQTTANLLHITRPLRSLSEKPFRFILVDSPEQFKPEYWNRVVAVFTTGQTWQFRSYKWREPQELFGHVMGVYIGEKGLPVPAEVKGWGSAVRSFTVDRWDERAHGAGVAADAREGRRWRDREIVEEVWRALEGYMRGKGSEWRR